jgi:hypothetical protein
VLLGGLQLGHRGVDGSKKGKIRHSRLVGCEEGDVAELGIERLEALGRDKLVLVRLVELLKPLVGGGLGLVVGTEDVCRLAGQAGELVGKVGERQRAVALELLDCALRCRR